MIPQALFGSFALDELAGLMDWFARMRAEQPVLYNERLRVWHVFRYADVQEVLSDHARFSSEPRAGSATPFAGSFLEHTLIATDPPEHRKLRNLVNLAFTPRALAWMEQRVVAITQELLDQVRSQGHMDIVDDLAFPLPAKIIAELLGVPAEDWAIFRRWARGEPIQPTVGRSGAAAGRSGARLMQSEMYDYFSALLAERRRSPRQDVLSILSNAEIDGQRLSQDELVSFSMLLLAAGQETTKNLLSAAIVCLTDHPDQLELLRRQPELVPAAVEEVLRFMPPAVNLARITTADVTLAGQHIPADQVLLAWILSANRDDAQFAGADRFDVQRAPSRHLSFGHGVHYCLGAPLARLEARVALPMLLEQLPDLRRVPGATVRASMRVVLTIQHLPVSFTPS